MKNFIKKYFYTPVEILDKDPYSGYAVLILFWVAITIFILGGFCLSFIFWKFDIYFIRTIILYIIFTILIFYKYE